MSSEDSDNYEDNDVDDATHKRLLENILNLNKKQDIKKPARTEPSLEVSEFNLVKSGTGNKGTVNLADLTKVLKQRATHVDVSNKIKNTEKKAKTLQKPLEKPEAERIKRSVAYENVKKQFNKWDPIVTSNRAANTLSFPLEFDTRLEDRVLARAPYRLKSELQKKLEALEPQEEVIHVDMSFEANKPTLTMEEMEMKRKEAAKLRAHQSYKEAKARRQNKIKSKKYHRIQRKERIKQQMQEFELLQKTNPEAALQKLEEIERARAEERLTLRHKSTGKWARNKQIRAKYDKESRQALAQQLAISKDLTEKTKVNGNSDSENEAEDLTNGIEIKNPILDENNPWSKITQNEANQDSESDTQDDTLLEQFKSKLNEQNDNSAKVYEEESDEEIEEKSDQELEEKSDDDIEDQKCPKIKSNLNISSTSDWEVSTLQVNENNDCIDGIINNLETSLLKKLDAKYKKVIAEVEETNSMKKRKNPDKNEVKNKKPKIDLNLYKEAKRPNLDDGLIEGPSNNVREKLDNIQQLKAILSNPSVKELQKKKPKQAIDPNKINMKPTPLDTELPDLTSYDDNEEDVDAQGMLCEAFEDDEIVDEFNKEKKEEIEKDTPKDVDLYMPGWGQWGGHNVKESKKKRKRFIIKMPKKLPRRDDNKGNLVLNENGNASLKNHLVSEVPFPFKSVKDFEASVRAPIGNTFVPETAFQKLIQPAVTTKLGSVITPMSEDILLKKMKKR